MTEELRLSKLDDQENATKALNILDKIICLYPGIEPTMWASACFTMIANSYQQSGISYENFCNEMERAIKHYKYMWEEQEG